MVCGCRRCLRVVKVLSQRSAVAKNWCRVVGVVLQGVVALRSGVGSAFMFSVEDGLWKWMSHVKAIHEGASLS